MTDGHIQSFAIPPPVPAVPFCLIPSLSVPFLNHLTMSILSIHLGSCAYTPEDPATVLAKTAPSSIDQLDFVVDAAELSISTVYDPMALSGWVSVLRPGATVSVRVQGEAVDLQPVHTSFLLAGLVSVSERREEDGSRVLTATKKETVSSGAPLKKVTVNILSDDKNDLIDEDGLLEEDGNGLLAPPPAMSEAAAAATDDCGGRKACDNCTCGRAEQEAGSEQPKQIATSSCGKCALGDAFRCASCPYLGKPAFKPGEEHLVLDLTDDF